ncbi:hypothetical protein PROVRUST_08394 [Providencia rustigianii DSM 4541]|uniref:Uncharacterized protein n=2 Tax=Providencia rustigianii TaxID=158850 RepID=D1P813_9GAMM|nr:hypothetical protein PROVRUST_08394 [Providencia rustigianii DSM 4541]
MKGGKMKTVTIKQSIDDFKSRLQSLKKYSPAFEFYIKKINQGETLPRGKYFRNRVAGNKPVIMDEFWIGDNAKKLHEEINTFHKLWG